MLTSCHLQSVKHIFEKKLFDNFLIVVFLDRSLEKENENEGFQENDLLIANGDVLALAHDVTMTLIAQMKVMNSNPLVLNHEDKLNDLKVDG